VHWHCTIGCRQVLGVSRRSQRSTARRFSGFSHNPAIENASAAQLLPIGGLAAAAGNLPDGLAPSGRDRRKVVDARPARRTALVRAILREATERA
jgi:hypothetical protein